MIRHKLITGLIELDNSRFVLLDESRKYTVHLFDLKKIKNKSEVSAIVFDYPDDLKKAVGFDGYVYPGTICEIGASKSKKSSS